MFEQELQPKSTLSSRCSLQIQPFVFMRISKMTIDPIDLCEQKIKREKAINIDINVSVCVCVRSQAISSSSLCSLHANQHVSTVQLRIAVAHSIFRMYKESK